MGLYGKGSARRKEIAATASIKTVFPWTARGLKRADRVKAFCEWLPITKGPLAGEQMRLLPGQQQFIEEVYGNVDSRGLRRRRIAIKSEPKGNGKTGLIAGLCLCH